MARKPKSPPKCVAPMCEEDALHRVSASGDHGEFNGELCDKHYDSFKDCFPARWLQVAFLRIITCEVLDAVLDEQNL